VTEVVRTENTPEPAEPTRQVDSARLRLEAELRHRGLPLMVRHDRRGSAILRRSAPALGFLLLNEPLSSLLTSLLSVPPDELTRRLSNSAWVFGLLAITVALLVAPWFFGALMSRWVRALRPTGGVVLAGALLVLVAFGAPLIEWATGVRATPWLGLAVNIVLALLVLVGVYVGAGSILAWAVRCAWRQLGTVGTMATRALPLLVIVVLFAFFSTEMWQIAEALPRWRLWLLVTVLIVLSVLFMITMLRQELRKTVQEAIEGRLPALPGEFANLAGAPDADQPVKPEPPTRGERANLMLVLFLPLALQILLLSVLAFCLFVGLGALALEPSVVDTWLGDGKYLEAGTLFGIPLPLPKALVQLAIFLAVFSGLYFTASVATDQLYREAFFEPVVKDLKVGLAVRHAYLARRGDGA
jgi:MFS family permease